MGRSNRSPRGHGVKSAQYRRAVARYVIDARTLLQIIDDDVPVHPGVQLVAPSAIRSEAMDLLLADVRSDRRTDKAALEVHERVTERKMRLLNDRVTRRVAWQIARERGWDTLRDAEYLAVTRLQADALVTVDHDLAAKAEGTVPVAGLRALIDGA